MFDITILWDIMRYYEILGGGEMVSPWYFAWLMKYWTDGHNPKWFAVNWTGWGNPYNFVKPV